VVDYAPEGVGGVVGRDGAARESLVGHCEERDGALGDVSERRREEAEEEVEGG
jgi:hypothetical protein